VGAAAALVVVGAAGCWTAVAIARPQQPSDRRQATVTVSVPGVTTVSVTAPPLPVSTDSVTTVAQVTTNASVPATTAAPPPPTTVPKPPATTTAPTLPATTSAPATIAISPAGPATTTTAAAGAAAG